MDPRKTNARRGYRQRESRRQAATNWQPEVFTPKEGKKMNKNFLTVLVVVLLLSVCCLAFVVLGGGAYAFWPRPAAVVSTQAPALVEEPPVSLLPTAAPVIPTEAPAMAEPTEIPTLVPTEVPEPVAVSCDTPLIDASLDGQTWESMGLFLDTVLGKRMTFTSRSLLVPEKEWNVELTSAELKTVEETWQSISMCVPEGTFARIFAGGFEQKLNHLDSGVIMTLKPGLYEFKLRNGEIVLWYPEQNDFAAKDLVRIIEQIKVGNFDIKSPLAFFGVTGDILSQIPQDLVKERNVQVIFPADPVVK